MKLSVILIINIMLYLQLQIRRVILLRNINFYGIKNIIGNRIRLRLEMSTNLDFTEQNEYSYHKPVMLEECMDSLVVKHGGLYIDCTLGGGGHTKAILQRGGSVIGLDQDLDAVKTANEILQDYIKMNACEIIQSNFRNIETALSMSQLFGSRTPPFVDGVLMDLGVSSHQINEPSRGFAFGSDGPLDMRMSNAPITASSLTAAKILNEWSLSEIADALFQFGDEKRSRQIAREIVASRPLNSTGHLVQVISRITSFKERPKTLARCFQALRIVVNDEMGALDDALMNMHKFIRPGGRLVVLSYHSLEDRRVKKLFRSGSVYGEEQSTTSFSNINPWIELARRALPPTDEEVETNRRSRSAKLRAATRAPLPTDPVAQDISNMTLEITDSMSGRMKKKKQKLSAPFIGAKQLAKMLAADKENE